MTRLDLSQNCKVNLTSDYSSSSTLFVHFSLCCTSKAVFFQKLFLHINYNIFSSKAFLKARNEYLNICHVFPNQELKLETVLILNARCLFVGTEGTYTKKKKEPHKCINDELRRNPTPKMVTHSRV
jgi:hypothetical protein